MKKLIISAISILLVACNSNDNSSKDTNILVGTWELTWQSGYEISDGKKTEWNKKPVDYDITYTFNNDHTGIYSTFEHANEEYSNTQPIVWAYNETSKTLAVDYTEAGDKTIYTIESISPSTLILVTHKKQEQYNYEYYNKETFTKK